MTEEKQGGLLPDLGDMPNPGSHEDDPPSSEEYRDDFEREGREEAGQVPIPIKTIPFWISLITTVIAYLLASQALPADTPVWTFLTFLVTSAAYFGYDGAVTAFRLHEGFFNDGTNRRPFQKPTFYLSFLATMSSYMLGSGLPDDSVGMRIAGFIVVGLGYVGININAWIQRRDMSDPSNPDGSFIGRLLSFMFQMLNIRRSEVFGIGEEEEESEENEEQEEESEENKNDSAETES